MKEKDYLTKALRRIAYIENVEQFPEDGKGYWTQRKMFT